MTGAYYCVWHIVVPQLVSDAIMNGCHGENETLGWF